MRFVVQAEIVVDADDEKDARIKIAMISANVLSYWFASITIADVEEIKNDRHGITG
jgi:hypothetical protein